MTCAPTLERELDEWVATYGGGNSGCCGNKLHDYGYHMRGDQITPLDYSRKYDPGMPYNMKWCCAGDFYHGGNSRLRAMHATLLGRILNGEFPTVMEFIGKPYVGQPVLYFHRYEGLRLRKYTGVGHDLWSHIGIQRSRANETLNLWKPKIVPVTQEGPLDMRLIYCAQLGKWALVGERTFEIVDGQLPANETAEVWDSAHTVSLAAWNRQLHRVKETNA